MHYAYRYRLHPTDSHREKLDSGINTCRQLHNHALNELEQIPDQLPGLKDWYGELSDLYSTVSQAVVMHIENIIKALSDFKKNGYNVGSLNWKAPTEFRSFTYVQSGFEFDNKNGQTVLSLSVSKLADSPVTVHREIPEGVTVKGYVSRKSGLVTGMPRSLPKAQTSPRNR